MQYRPKLLDVDKDKDVVVVMVVVMVVEGIHDTMVLMVIITQILHKRKASLHHPKWNNNEAKQENGKCLQDKPPKNHDNSCCRCGMKGN